ncbi:glycoside hydrolase family 88 protein [Leifsonia bigeumensis]|uniref:Glycoside hydrolase family 88 protein n=1 Tax=Leifsonella bigeumensis TaxID=433643 RepID=A0ABP7F4V0_9MICO
MTIETSLGPIRVEELLHQAEEQVRRLVTEHPGKVPVFTQGGRWQFDGDAWAPVWTGGFLAGMMWIFSQRFRDPFWRENAERYSRLLEERKHDTGTHDIGFLFSPSWGRWHEVAPSQETRDVLIEAGTTMAGRFNPAGRYLRTWVDAGSTFIDVMMNIGIIYQAADLSGNAALAEIATKHALTSRRFLVRGDATTVHEGWFDPDSGEFLRAATHQGYRSDSSWVRGHAWAIYGFGTAYQWTGDARFLDTARRCADTYITEVGDRFVGPNDWEQPAPNDGYEASGASITASGLLQLADLLGDAGDDYRRYARSIVARLSEPEFFGAATTGWEGIIKHSTYHENEGLGVNESVMWGDYYFVEALDRLAGTPEPESSAGPSRR